MRALENNTRAHNLVLENRVLVIMTGGTICMRHSQSGFIPAKGFQKACLSGVSSFDDGSPSSMIDVKTTTGIQPHPSLQMPNSIYGKRVRYTVFEFEELLDSCSVDASDWTAIADSISRNYDLFDGFVILHGTDTLAYTCSALSFLLEALDKPVILTGAQTPIGELQSDASSNLLGSLVIAGHFEIPEVCLYFNYRLFRGNRVTKVAANGFAAFDSPNYPPLAVTTSLRTNVEWDLIRAPEGNRSMVVQARPNTAQVACIRLFPGIRPEIVDAVLKLDGLRGLVLETYGPGSAPPGRDDALIRVLADATKRGIVIVSVTQCLTGTVNPVYASVLSLSHIGVVTGLDMTTEAALTKLGYLLALPNSTPESTARDMSTSLRGELTELSQPSFRHPRRARI